MAKNTTFCLKNTYFILENKFKRFLNEKNLSERYIKDLINIGSKLFSNIKDNSKVEVVLGEVDKNNYTKKYIFLLFRNLIKFWDEEEIEIPNDVITKLTKFKKPKENKKKKVGLEDIVKNLHFLKLL